MKTSTVEVGEMVSSLSAAYADTVSVIDIKSRALVSIVRGGKGPNGVSVNS